MRLLASQWIKINESHCRSSDALQWSPHDIVGMPLLQCLLSAVGARRAYATYLLYCVLAHIIYSSTGTFILNFIFIFVAFLRASTERHQGASNVDFAFFFSSLSLVWSRFAYIWLHTKANLIKWSRAAFLIMVDRGRKKIGAKTDGNCLPMNRAELKTQHVWIYQRIARNRWPVRSNVAQAIITGNESSYE